MKVSLLLSGALFANFILASPRGLAQRVATRTRQTTPLIKVNEGTKVVGNNVTNVEYSSNWAGAVLTAPPAGQTFTAVSGQFTVPTPSVPSGGSGSYSASIWVGIDGDTYQDAILQSGIDVTVKKSWFSSTSYSYDSWYEWYPAYATDFSTSQFSFKAGDTISVSVTSSSNTTGTVVLDNITTGKTVTQAVSAPSATAALGGQNAEWIVEDYEENGQMVNLANFGTVTISDCVAKTQSSTEGLSGAQVLEMESSSGTVLTDVTIVSSSEVQLVYE